MQKLVFMIVGELGPGSCCWTNIGYLKAMLDREVDTVVTSVRYCEIASIRETVKEVTAEGNTYYCFSVLQHNYLDCLEYAKAIKSQCSKSVCIWGNIMATFHAEYILKNYPEVDFISVGEGELTLVELIGKLTRGLEVSQCKGIYYRIQDRVVFSGCRELISNLDEIPFPDRSFIPEKYRNPISMLQIPVFASRGCLGTCTFCDARVINTNLQGRACVRTRTIRNVIAEIKAIKQEFQNLCIYFMDSTFCTDTQNAYIRLEELYDELRESGLDINFFMNLRAEQFDDRLVESLKQLKNVGLKFLFVGFESGSQDDLKLYGKRATRQDNINALEHLRKSGFLNIASPFGFDFGFINFNPYSTIKKLWENYEFLSKEGLPTTIYHLTSILQITSSTPITKKLQRDGLLTDCSDGPICDPYAYKFKDQRVFNIWELLRNILNRIHFQDFYRTIDYYSLYRNQTFDYDSLYLQYKSTLSDYMEMNKKEILGIYRSILECTESGSDMPYDLERQIMALSRYNLEQGRIINFMLRRMNHHILRRDKQR